MGLIDFPRQRRRYNHLLSQPDWNQYENITSTNWCLYRLLLSIESLHVIPSSHSLIIYPFHACIFLLILKGIFLTLKIVWSWEVNIPFRMYGIDRFSKDKVEGMITYCHNQIRTNMRILPTLGDMSKHFIIKMHGYHGESSSLLKLACVWEAYYNMT